MNENRIGLREPRYPAAEIRNRCPDISMSFVAYLRNKGFIKPERIDSPSGGHPSYCYSEWDIEIAIRMWRYTREIEDKLKLDAAYKKSVKEIENLQLEMTTIESQGK